MQEREYDIVIIGSGAGGGAAAKELAPLCADGVKIAVLEMGAKLKEEEYTGREVEMSRRLYIDSGGTLTKDRAMTLAYGRAYGGSTVVYTGTSLTMPEEVVERWNVPGLEYEDLHRRSLKYLEENNVHLLPEDELNDNNRLFLKGCTKLGYHVEQFPINTKGCLSVQPRLPQPGQAGHSPGAAAAGGGRGGRGDHQLPGHQDRGQGLRGGGDGSRFWRAFALGAGRVSGQGQGSGRVRRRSGQLAGPPPTLGIR